MEGRDCSASLGYNGLMQGFNVLERAGTIRILKVRKYKASYDNESIHSWIILIYSRTLRMLKRQESMALRWNNEALTGFIILAYYEILATKRLKSVAPCRDNKAIYKCGYSTSSRNIRD